MVQVPKVADKVLRGQSDAQMPNLGSPPAASTQILRRKVVIPLRNNLYPLRRVAFHAANRGSP